MRRHHSAGFSLIELLLVVGIIAILAGVAVPGLLGVRDDAKRKGDAQAACKSLQMMLETNKAESGTYGPVGVYVWTPSGPPPALPNVPFVTQGNTIMTYTLTINAGGLAYTLLATDTSKPKNYFLTDQTQASLAVPPPN
jgi:prepilin-type N-terminal cleavage/methylation domain-containing protein